MGVSKEKRHTWLALSGVCLLLCGCVTENKRTPRQLPIGTGPVQELHLLTTPFAVNLNSAPGPDGLAAKVYASNQRQPQPVPILEGAIEVLMYNGLLESLDPAKTAPHRTWRLNAEQLKTYEQQSPIGIGYQLMLPWGTNAPTKARFTVVARYLAPQGATIYSTPSVIALSK